LQEISRTGLYLSGGRADPRCG